MVADKIRLIASLTLSALTIMLGAMLYGLLKNGHPVPSEVVALLATLAGYHAGVLSKAGLGDGNGNSVSIRN